MSQASEQRRQSAESADVIRAEIGALVLRIGSLPDCYGFRAAAKHAEAAMRELDAMAKSIRAMDA